MEFIIGYDLQKSGFSLDEFRKDFILTSNIDDFDTTEEKIIKANPSHLIALRENQEIIGWAIWHESSTREHQKGSSRDKSDIDILEKLFGRTKEIIELHELWIKKMHRRKGFGKQFFDFFENFVLSIGYDSIVYYTDDLAAITICRQRDYKEAFNEELKWYTFCKIIKIP